MLTKKRHNTKVMSNNVIAKHMEQTGHKIDGENAKILEVGKEII